MIQPHHSDAQSIFPDSRDYARDSSMGVWIKPGMVSIPDETADAVAEVLASASDISADSDELRSKATSWPLVLFLGSEGLNALRPVRHLLSGRVLEFAADYGNTTRFLAECATEVMSVAATYPLAVAVSARCRNISNVTVICDDLPLNTDFGAFDAVVIRWPGGLCEGQLDLPTMLHWSRRILRPVGVLILVIDNRLSLTRFAGNQEAGERPGCTGRAELDSALKQAGYGRREFLFLFPESRTSKAVLTPAMLTADPVATSSLLETFSATYTAASGYQRNFAEALLWRDVLTNGLVPDLSNSFLVIASPTQRNTSLLPPDIAAYAYATNRRRRFQKQTLITASGDEWRVLRDLLHPEEQPAPGPVTQYLSEEPFVSGRVYAHVLTSIVNRPGWTMEDVVAWADPYVQYLEANVESEREGAGVLPDNFVDCTPFNIILRGDELEPFDLEWRAADAPTLKFVCFRGLLYTFASLTEVAAPVAGTDLHVLRMVLTTMRQLGHALEGDDLETFWKAETALQVCVVGDHARVDEDYWKTAMLQVRSDRTRSEPAVEGATGAESYLMQEVIAAKDALIRHLSAERIRLAKAVDEHRAEVAAVRREFANTLEILRTELTAARQEREERLLRLSQASQMIQRLQEKAAELGKTIESKTLESAELRRQLSLAHDEIAELETRRGSVAELAGKYAAEAAELKHYVSGIEASAAAAMQESARIRGELQRALAENEQLAVSLASERDEASRLHQEQANRTKQLATADTRAKTVLAELELTRSQLADRDREATGLRQDLGRESARARQLDSALDAKQQEALRLAHDLRETRKSLSWRVTAPLRATLDGIVNAPVRIIGIARLAVLRFAPGHRIIYRRIRESGLFDAAYYRATYPDVGSRPVDPLVHYLYAGMAEHRWPNPLFDPGYYIARNPDAAENPLLHYIQRGDARNAPCHPLFDAAFFRTQCGEAIANSGLTALGYYLRHGASQRYEPHPLFDTDFYLSQNPPGDGPALVRYLREPVGKPKSSPHPLFDPVWYLQLYPDVARAGMEPLVHYALYGHLQPYNPHWLFDSAYYGMNPGAGELPLRHYLLHGWKEGRTPHPLFDPAYYLESNPEVKQTGADPLRHYLVTGWRTAKQPHPLFDSAYYLEGHPEAAASGMSPIRYFLTVGAALGHSPHPLFDTGHYLQQVSDVAPADALAHFLENGRELRSSPHPLFDSAYYLERYPDVADTAMNPLTHYLRFGVREGRNPHPLFHTAYYRHRYKGELFGMNPLVHYARYGGTLQGSPHPLFDASFYLRNRQDLRRCGIPALTHYAACSGIEATDPHPLFDTRYYREQLPDLGSASPLIHYLRSGWQKQNPHRLFDTDYYRAAHPDPTRGGMTPLEHYLFHWSDDGANPHPLFDNGFYLRQSPPLQEWQSPLEQYLTMQPSSAPDPHPEFDTGFYLRQVPDPDDTGMTALEHYLTIGAASGLDPNPRFHTEEYMKSHPELSETGVNPLAHSVLSAIAGPGVPAVESGTADKTEVALPPSGATHPRKLRVSRLRGSSSSSGPRSGKVILCITHVVFHPARAGNEYRFNRLLRHLEQQGYRTIVLFVPIEPASDSVLEGLASVAPDLIVCRHDGSILYQFQGDDSVLSSLNGAHIPVMPSGVLGENAPADKRAAELIRVDQTFSHDALCKIALHLHRSFQPCVVLANYVFMTRFLPFLSGSSLRIIDTIDVFSTKAKKVMTFGVDDGLSMSMEEERRRLLRAHAILAIQDGERKEFEAIVPERRVLTVGVDFEVESPGEPPEGRDILLIASDNAMNVKGLRDFLRFAWPIIAREEPAARLLVAGRVSRTTMAPDERVCLLGPVEDVRELYRRARVVINPAVAGTGLKIKTVEALCHLKPVIGWPNGFDGLDERIAKLCPVATDWFEFATNVIHVLRDDRANWFTDEDAALIRESLSADMVYRDLDAMLRTFFETLDVDTALGRQPA